MSRNQIAFGWPEIDEVWKRVTEAFAFYGKQIRPLRGARRDHISRLIADGYTADELVAAVHGYVHFHGGLDEHADGFKPRKWFDPDSVYRLEKLERRIELGEAGAFVHVSREEAHAAEVKARQAAARARVEAARAAQDGRNLRAV